MVFIDWYLPGFMAGGPIRSLANLVNRLPYNFYIVTSAYDHYATSPYDLPTGEWITRSENEHVMYLLPGELTKAKFDSILSYRTFDRYYINSLFSVSFALNPMRWLKKAGLAEKVVLAPRGMLKPGALSIKPLKKKIFLTLAKAAGLFANITWHATGMDEEREIKQHFKNAHIKTAQNLSRPAKPRINPAEKAVNQLKLITVARVSPEKNLLGAAEYLKNIAGDVQWDVYGTIQDQAYLEQCKATLDTSTVKVQFKGEVNPSALPALFEEYHFFYLMTLGENFGHAIAESLISGLPVIISDRTPWRNLEAEKAGWDLPLTLSDVQQVLTLAAEMDQKTYAVWCQGALNLGSTIANDSTAYNHSIALFI